MRYVKVDSTRVVGGKIAALIHISVPLFGIGTTANGPGSSGNSPVKNGLQSIVLGVNGTDGTSRTGLIVSL